MVYCCIFPLKIQKKSCKKLVINQGNGYKVGSKARKKLSPKWMVDISLLISSSSLRTHNGIQISRKHQPVCKRSLTTTKIMTLPSAVYHRQSLLRLCTIKYFTVCLPLWKNVPDGHEHFPCHSDPHFQHILFPYSHLCVAEFVVKASLGFRGGPCTFYQCPS